MTADNIAICFTPSIYEILLKVDKSEQKGEESGAEIMDIHMHLQSITKILVENVDVIFPDDLEGPSYEKIIGHTYEIQESSPEGDTDGTLQTQKSEPSSDDHKKKEDSWIIEAFAKYDFKARSERELGFKKGDLLFLMKRLSPDWWLGQHPCDITDDDGDGNTFTAALKGKPLLVPHGKFQ